MTRSIHRMPGGRRLAVAAAAAFAAIGLVAAPAASAHATTVSAASATAPGDGFVLSPSAVRSFAVHPMSDPADCPSTYLCMWVDKNWVGKMGKVNGNNKSWTGSAFAQSYCAGGTWNDCASGLYNNGQYDEVEVFQDANYLGGHGCIPIGTTAYADLADYTWGQNGEPVNDSISSNYWYPSC